ncbi:MAG: diguanylate cyclase [Limnothrix sp. RL_2_0]|nr:diguanylate cyclase [Limnothrix sp. RL_2_0]
MVKRLFVFNICTVTTLIVVHLGEYLIGQWQISDVPVWLAIAFHSILIIGILGLLAKICSIFKLSKKNFSRNLKLVQKKLHKEQQIQQATITALQDSEDRFQSIFNYAAVGITLIDRQGKILEANQAYKDIGIHDIDITQNNWLMDNTHPEDFDQDRKAIAQLFNNKALYYSYNKRYLHPDGSILWIDLRMSLVQPETPGAAPYAVAMFENITQRKEIEQELVCTQERLQELLQVRTDQIVQMHEELSWQTNHDFLTGLLNRYAFERQLSQLLNTLRHKRKLRSEHTLCYLNLDRFKAINELGGSLAGDAVLQQVSQIIENRCRQSDYIARLGADEFALLLYECTLEQAEKVALSIVERIQMGQFCWQDQEYSTSVSIGLVPINASSGDASEIMIAADAACYAAKRRGRSRIHIYESDDQELVKFRSEAQWINKIEEALKNDRFQLYVQPIIPMHPEADPPHCEVLVRLLSENGDVLSPGLFLPAAERYHLVTKIDYWVIEATLRHLALNLTERTKSHIYSINLSGASINDESLVDFLQRQFELYPIPTKMICFEVTETVRSPT